MYPDESGYHSARRCLIEFADIMSCCCNGDPRADSDGDGDDGEGPDCDDYGADSWP